MTDLALIGLIVFVGGFFISVTCFGFIRFSKFLDKEKASAERFREANQPRPKSPFED